MYGCTVTVLVTTVVALNKEKHNKVKQKSDSFTQLFDQVLRNCLIIIVI